VHTSDLTFLHGESVPRCAHVIDKHFVGYQTLQYMSAGAVDLSIGDEPRALRGRWFWSAYPGPRIAFHAAAQSKHWRHRYLAFRGPRVERWQADGLFPVPPQPAPKDRDFGPPFDRLLDYSVRRNGEPFAAIRATHMLEELLIELAEDRAAATKRPAWLRAAVAQLDAAARTGGDVPTDYAAIADRLGMAEVTFRRRFRELMNVPPHEYVLQSRVAEARRLLAEGDEPIKTIAARLGYRDVYFFSRQFKRFTGVPPALFRKSRQA
jgi:AraC-like DNA-binding protein